MLGSQGNIDAADRDSLLRHFRDALDEQSAASEPVDVDRMQADVAQTPALMQQHGLLDSQGSADMGKAFAQARQPPPDDTLHRAPALPIPRRHAAQERDNA